MFWDVLGCCPNAASSFFDFERASAARFFASISVDLAAANSVFCWLVTARKRVSSAWLHPTGTKAISASARNGKCFIDLSQIKRWRLERIMPQHNSQSVLSGNECGWGKTAG